MPGQCVPEGLPHRSSFESSPSSLPKVIQSHARYCLAALHCHERAEAAKLENLQGWRDQENARAPQDRLWRWEAALEVQRVYRYCGDLWV